jgi:photosystem II stability/assembly factor-like uncharacterized protein
MKHLLKDRKEDPAMRASLRGAARAFCLAFLLLAAGLAPLGLGKSFAQTGWIQQYSGVMGYGLWGVSFTSADTGTVVGFSGSIRHTTDGGALWNNQDTVIDNLTACSFVNGNTGTVVGYSGTILRTTDGGATWTRQTTGDATWLWGVSFTDPNHGTAVGYDNSSWVGRIFHTTNGGVSWSLQYTHTVRLIGAFFYDQKTGWAVGDFESILHTTDGGSTWTLQYYQLFAPTLYSVSFPNASTGTVVGQYGLIFHTTDGGTSWAPQSAGTNFSWLHGVSFTDPNTGTAVGADTTGSPTNSSEIVRTTDGGVTWNVQPSGLHFPYLCGVCFTNSDTGTAVGYSGTILHTTTGGTWVEEDKGQKGKASSDQPLVYKVYPNPFISFASAPGHEKEDFVLYNIFGRRVGNCRGDRVGVGLTPGVYFLKPEGRDAKPLRIVKIR